MKKSLTAFVLGLILFVLTSAIPASNTTSTTFDPSTIRTNAISNEMTIENVIYLSNKDFSKLKGGKITLKEKLYLKLIQRELKKEVKSGKISKDQKVDFKKFYDDDARRFNIWGFLIGFFLGLIGVGLVYIFSDNPSLRRSSWYGLGILIILALLGTLL